MKNPVSSTRRPVDRRSFMKRRLLAGGAATVGAGLLARGTSVHAQEQFHAVTTEKFTSATFDALDAEVRN